jgi:esterase/lipase superfamily enzyme
MGKKLREISLLVGFDVTSLFSTVSSADTQQVSCNTFRQISRHHALGARYLSKNAVFQNITSGLQLHHYVQIIWRKKHNFPSRIKIMGNYSSEMLFSGYAHNTESNSNILQVGEYEFKTC